jgi:hypothetical protein
MYTRCIQPTNCGCSPFHPTIGLDAFTLSTLATLVPGHDTTREPFSLSSQVIFKGHSPSLYSWYIFSLHPPSLGLNEVYHISSQHQPHDPLSLG